MRIAQERFLHSAFSYHFPINVHLDGVEVTQLRLLVFDDARGREEGGFIAYLPMQSQVGNAANCFTDSENVLKGTKVLT